MPPDQIVPPIVVAEGWDLTFHRSPRAVLSHYEPWFVSTVEYRAFDAEGRRLALVADPPVVAKRLIGPFWTDNAHTSSLTIRAVETEPSGADEFADLLREWLAMVDVPLVDPEPLSLRELLDCAVARVGFT